jgi:hypothetical protein
MRYIPSQSHFKIPKCEQTITSFPKHEVDFKFLFLKLY